MLSTIRASGNHCMIPPPFCSFQVPNMRQPLQFVYLKGGWFSTNTLVATTPLITFRWAGLACHSPTLV